MATTKNCSVCGAPLTGKQRKYCSKVCGNGAYREANKEKITAYRKANKEKITAYAKAYHEANKEKITARRTAYRTANRDKLKAQYRAQNKAYRREHPEIVLRTQAKRFFGVPNPPEELLQAKVQQLKILRLIKDKDRVGKPAG